MKLYQQKIQTPLGTMVACANENGLCLFDFEDTKNLDKELLQVSEKLQSTIYEEEKYHLKTTKNTNYRIFQWSEGIFLCAINTHRNQIPKGSLANLTKNPLWKHHFLPTRSHTDG